MLRKEAIHRRSLSAAEILASEEREDAFESLTVKLQMRSGWLECEGCSSCSGG